MASKKNESFERVQECLEDFLANVVTELTKNLRDARGGRGANATGSLSQSIGENLQDGVEITAKGFNLNIELNDYYVDVDEGQEAGTRVSTRSILHWLQNKPNLEPRQPILPDEDIAYLISRKIFRKGTEATNFYSDVMTKKRIDELFKCVTEAGAKDITDSLDNTF